MAVQSYVKFLSQGGKSKWKRFIEEHLPLMCRFFKFCLVGGIGVVVDMGVLFILTNLTMFGFSAVFSKICAAEVALLNNFVWNELWTFRRNADRSHPNLDLESDRSEQFPVTEIRHWSGILRRFLVFHSICSVGIGLGVFFLYLLHSKFGWNLYASNFASIVLATFWNFGANVLFNWKASNEASNVYKG